MEEISFMDHLLDLDQKALERVLLRLALAKNQQSMINEAIFEAEETIKIVESRMKIKETKKEALEKKLEETTIKNEKVFPVRNFLKHITA